MAIGGRPKPEFLLLTGRLWWTFLPKERHCDSLSDCGSNIQAFYLQEDALTLSNSYLVFCRIYPIPLKNFKPSHKQIKYISQYILLLFDMQTVVHN